MKIIISPAKRMKYDDFGFERFTKPIFEDRAYFLAEKMRKMNDNQLKTILKTNDKLTNDAKFMYENFAARQDKSAAILTFDGIQYKYMAPGVFDDAMYDYIENNVLIMSALYGVLRPFDAVLPYRLEMNSPVSLIGLKSMYEFWGRSLYDVICKDDDLVLGLTSHEYTNAVLKYFAPPKKFVYCSFGELVEGKVVEKGVYVKMARGDMVRYLAENDIHDLDGVRRYSGLGYKFNPELSDDYTLTFIKPQDNSRK